MMKMTVSVERLYKLGDYKNIRFTNVVSDYEGDEDDMKNISKLLTAMCEAELENYVQLVKDMSSAEVESKSEYLEQLINEYALKLQTKNKSEE